MKKLNLGSGEDYKPGWINLDNNKNYKADVYYNLDKFPYPFKNNFFDEVYMSMILEHVKDPMGVLKEIIRIINKGGKLTVIVPHATNYANFSDLQHKTNFTENSFQKSLLKEYDLKELVLVKIEFIYKNKWKKYIPFKRILKIIFMGIYDDIKFTFNVQK